MQEKVLMKGNEAIAEAAIRCGCRHYLGYPITPQTEIAAYMAKRMPKIGGVFLAMKAADCAEEVQGAAHAFEVLGIGEPETLRYTVPHDGVERALVRLPKISETPAQYPRRFKKIQTSPL